MGSINTKSKITAIVKAAADKKASDIVIIDMRKMPSIGDYFVIASGDCAPQLEAIADNIIDKLKTLGCRPWHIEADPGKATWVLLDYSDVVVHVFHEETRRFYNLERLWGDAPQRRFEPAAKKTAVHGKRGLRKKTRRRGRRAV